MIKKTLLVFTFAIFLSASLISAAEFESTYPTLIDSSIDPSAGPVGTVFTITAQFFDTSGVVKAEAKIIRNDLFIEKVTMSLTNGSSAINGTWKAQWISTGSTGGIYHVNLTACDVLEACGEYDKVLSFGINACSDGTLPGACSPTKPKKCTESLTFENDCGDCGCPSGSVCSVDGTCMGTCDDGSLSGQCGKTKPQYCDNGNLINKCQTCGCPAGDYMCLSDGSCKVLCSDGTPDGACAEEQPKFCWGGDLIDDCTECGCPLQYSCGTDKKCFLSSCTDGTPIGECSTPPKFCDESGNIVDDYIKCPVETPGGNGENGDEGMDEEYNSQVMFITVLMIILIIVVILIIFVL